MLLHHLVSCWVISSTGFTDTSCDAKAFDYHSAAIHSSAPLCPFLQVTDFCLPLQPEYWSSGCLWASIHWAGSQQNLCSCRVNPIASHAACSWISPCHHSGKQEWPRQHRLPCRFWLHPSSCLTHYSSIPVNRVVSVEKQLWRCGACWGQLCHCLFCPPCVESISLQLTTQPFHQGCALEFPMSSLTLFFYQLMANWVYFFMLLASFQVLLWILVSSCWVFPSVTHNWNS